MPDVASVRIERQTSFRTIYSSRTVVLYDLSNVQRAQLTISSLTSASSCSLTVSIDNIIHNYDIFENIQAGIVNEKTFIWSIT